MPEEETIERAREDEREGKSPSTQAGEFVREEMEHIREGRHGARSTRQAIAIGLSKARRAGVKLPPPRPGRTTAETRRKAERDLERGEHGAGGARSPRRSRAVRAALKREPRRAASHDALASQARRAAARRRRSGTVSEGVGTRSAAGRSPRRRTRARSAASGRRRATHTASRTAAARTSTTRRTASRRKPATRRAGRATGRVTH